MHVLNYDRGKAIYNEFGLKLGLSSTNTVKKIVSKVKKVKSNGSTM